ncbi:MAG: redoxin domain-containing protein [Sedimentisphaerales bacterium]
MRRYLISITVILIALTVAWPVLGQREGEEGRQPREGRRRFQDMSEEQRAKLRERFRSMSEEERQKFLAERRERFAGRGPMFGLQAQLKVIEAIEEQLAKLKASIEAFRPEQRRRFRDLSEEERAKLKERFTKVRQDRQAAISAIEEQLAKLRGPRPPMARPAVPIKELQEIHEMAVQENAERTAERLKKLLARYQRGPRERLQRPTRPGRGRERPTRPKRDVEGAAFGKKAPDFTLKSFDGKSVSLSDYRGKIVVLEWFNFECPFVQYHYDTTTTMVDLAKKYKDNNVVWLAVNSTNHTTAEANEAFAKKHKLPYLILDDRSGRVGRAYGAKTTPHMFVIDPAGRIVYEGAIDNSPLGKKKEGVINYVDRALAELTTGELVSTKNTKPYGCTVKYAR